MFRKISDIAFDKMCLQPQIHFDCDREMLIENCRRIEECNEVFMRLVSGRLYINVWGSGLRAFDFKTNGLIIRGKFSGIEFEERSSSANERSAERLREDHGKGK